MAELLRNTGGAWEMLVAVDPVPSGGTNYRAEIPAASVAALAASAGITVDSTSGLAANGTGWPYLHTGSAYDVRYGGTLVLSVAWFTDSTGTVQSVNLSTGVQSYDAIVGAFGGVPTFVDGWVQAPQQVQLFWYPGRNTVEVP